LRHVFPETARLFQHPYLLIKFVVLLIIYCVLFLYRIFRFYKVCYFDRAKTAGKRNLLRIGAQHTAFPAPRLLTAAIKTESFVDFL